MIGSWSNRIIDESRCYIRDRHALDTPSPDVNYTALPLAPRAHRGQACLGGAAPRLAPASPGDKDFCHAQAPQMTLIGSVSVPVTGPGPWRRARTGGLCEAGWMNEGGLMPVPRVAVLGVPTSAGA